MDNLPARVCKGSDGRLMPDFALFDDMEDWNKNLTKTLGIENQDLAQYILDNLEHANNGKLSETKVNAAIAFINALRPKDSLECMLAVQMFLSHEFAINALADSKLAVLPENTEKLCSISQRMMRLFLAQVEALRKNRNAGNQNITVNHIYSTNTIVGNFERDRGA